MFITLIFPFEPKKKQKMKNRLPRAQSSRKKASDPALARPAKPERIYFSAKHISVI
jgi:hypothetical protein